VTKSLVLLDQDRNPILAIVPGDRKLSFAKVRMLSERKRSGWCSSRRPSNTLAILLEPRRWCIIRRGMKVVLDKALAAFESIYGGGGTRTRLLELKVSDVMKLNKAVVADIVE